MSSRRLRYRKRLHRPIAYWPCWLWDTVGTVLQQKSSPGLSRRGHRLVILAMEGMSWTSAVGIGHVPLLSCLSIFIPMIIAHGWMLECAKRIYSWSTFWIFQYFHAIFMPFSCHFPSFPSPWLGGSSHQCCQVVKKHWSRQGSSSTDHHSPWRVSLHDCCEFGSFSWVPRQLSQWLSVRSRPCGVGTENYAHLVA